MQIPTKIQHGDKVISTVFTKLNGIIDYLNATRTKAGTGIMVQETPSGTVVSVVPKPMNVPVLNAGGSGATGFPNFFTTSSIVVNDNNSYTLTENMWLIGRIQATSTNTPADASFYLNVQQSSTSTPIAIKLFMDGVESSSTYHENFVCIPLASGITISFTKDYIGITASLILYPCT